MNRASITMKEAGGHVLERMRTPLELGYLNPRYAAEQIYYAMEAARLEEARKRLVDVARIPIIGQKG